VPAHEREYEQQRQDLGERYNHHLPYGQAGHPRHLGSAGSASQATSMSTAP
jgi:hypothetical protein